jgi:plasmid stabilization system protein ParE
VPILLPRPAFIAAVKERIAWLAENRTEEQLENFLSGLADVRRRIEQSPEAGPPMKQSNTHVLRMRLFPRPLPYLLFYGHAREQPLKEIYLVRLYGSGQDRADVDMSDWPW